MRKDKILIVDDNPMNRALLDEMLWEKYDILEAEDGVEAVAVLNQQAASISLVLLDIVMPRMNGFEVLEHMNDNGWIDEVPVIVISSENGTDQIRRAYELGVTDFIMRPFDSVIVMKRVVNTLLIYAKQKELVGMVEQQIYEKEQRSSLMIDILSHIVEFRNGESGLHILHVRTLTNFLLRKLRSLTDRYELDENAISDISVASALHDIGKIAIDEKILNKPGRLTPEEFEEMKKHSEYGAKMLENLPVLDSGNMVETAYQICRWHHERWDGRGYPDGLKGDDIPIAAQIVALADVYDALTSERIYKPPFTHDQAIKMIEGGECGAFNPLLLRCLSEHADELRDTLREHVEGQAPKRDALAVADLAKSSLPGGVSARTLELLEHERMKYNFVAEMTEEILFEVTMAPPMLTISAWGAKKLGLDEIIMAPRENEALRRVMGEGLWEELAEKLWATTPKNPNVSCERKILCGGEPRWHRIVARAVWSQDDPPEFRGALGKAIDIEGARAEKEELQRRASRDQLTGLLNRASARELIEQRMLDHPEGHFALAELDIDDFKVINDQNGHMFGDRVLRHLAEQMKGSVRSSDICCRAGGEEFFIFLEYNTDIERTFDRIYGNLCFDFEGREVTVSMGIALGQTVGLSYEALYRAADAALYKVKRTGKRRYLFYDDSLSDILREVKRPVTPIDGAEDYKEIKGEDQR